MRPGGGKGKGSGFEREVCAKLSLWISKGKNKDIFWRSAMSGGRATIHHSAGQPIRQYGDICAVAPEGHPFIQDWYIECKHLRNLAIASFLLKNEGPLSQFWYKAKQQALNYGTEPMIIAKQNHGPIIVITHIGRLERYTASQLTSHARSCDISLFSDMTLYQRLRKTKD